MNLFGDVYRGKSVLVTGHTGFKGSWLSLWLTRLGARVTGFSLYTPPSPSIFEVTGLANHVTHLTGDVRSLDDVRAAFAQAQPDFVFHLAAQPIVRRSYEAPQETVTTNVIGTTNVLEALRLSDRPCTAVMITSDKCYENVEWTWGYRENDRLGGRDPYSASKGAAEVIIRSYCRSFFQAPDSKTRAAAVRAGNVIGGGDWAADRIVPDAVRAWSQNQPVRIRYPEATRPWQHVLEPLGGYLRLGQAMHDDPALNGEAFNFGPAGDQNYTVAELLETIGRYWGFAKPADFVLAESGNHQHEAGLLKLSCDKALHRLGWQPTLSFERFTEFTAAWYQAYYREHADMYAFTHGQIDDYARLAAEKRLGWALVT